jgi:tRNA threonylcarbamoyladenosine biosynthesis protein TsaB
VGVALAVALICRARVGGVVNLLAIDTALDAVSVCLTSAEAVLANAEAESDRRHGEMLAPMIQAVLHQAGCTVRAVGCIAVDVGPGLFTGMRVGIATAKAMAEVLEADLVGVSSLEVLARQACSSGAADDLDVVAAIIDARRGEVFWSLFRTADMEQLTSPRAGSPEECVESIAARGQSTYLVGTGANRYATNFDDGLRLAVPDFRMSSPESGVPKASTVASIGRDRMVDSVTVDELVPMYLRAPDAEINWRTRSGS